MGNARRTGGSRVTSSKIGFTNKMAIWLCALLFIGILLSFLLAIYSIKNNYMGALACWTVCFTPLSAGIDIVLHAVVKKSQAENTSASGDGIKYRQAVGGEATI